MFHGVKFDVRQKLRAKSLFVFKKNPPRVLREKNPPIYTSKVHFYFVRLLSPPVSICQKQLILVRIMAELAEKLLAKRVWVRVKE